MPKKVIITVPLSGEITVETKGFGGKGCQDETKELEAELGEKMREKKTAEYFAPAKQETQIKNKA